MVSVRAVYSKILARKIAPVHFVLNIYRGVAGSQMPLFAFKETRFAEIRRSYFELLSLLGIIISIDSACTNVLYYMSVIHTVSLQVLRWSRIARAPTSCFGARGDTFFLIQNYSTSDTPVPVCTVLCVCVCVWLFKDVYRLLIHLGTHST
jgi:hypothetical protein